MTQLKTITVPAGIGDFAWIAMKLLNTGEKFHVNLPDGQPQRGHQMKDLLPNLIETITYKGGLSYKIINNNNLQRQRKTWKRIIESGEKKFFLSANEHLEKGIRIEEWLPDLPATFKIDYSTSESDKETAESLLKNHGKTIGIYTSAYGNSRHWNGWLAKEWIDFVGKIHLTDSKISFVIIGAPYDLGVSEEIMEWMNENMIDHVNTIGQPLGVVVELMRRMDYAFYFPSGLAILSETMARDCTMFYPKHLQRMIGSWGDPERIRDGSFKECLFCEPDKMFEWIKLTYKLFDRL